MTSLIFSVVKEFWPYIMAGVMGLIAAIGLRKSGSDSLKAKTAKDAAKRADKGNQAAYEAQEDLRKGKTPEEIVRENDEAWK